MTKKVFISYKHQDEKRNAWVEKLYKDLRSLGIDAILDKYEVAPGESFSDYMSRGVRDCDHVLFIVTPKSVAAVESGSGALAFEMQISNARRMANKDGFTIIPIFREGKSTSTYLSDHRYLDFRKEHDYEIKLKLLFEWLTGKIAPPKLGPEISNEDIFAKQAYLYGVMMDENRSEIEIHEDGTAFIKSKLVITATREGIDSIERYTTIIPDLFTGDINSILPTRRQMLPSNHLILLTPVIITSTDSSIRWLLKATPAFPKDIPITYQYQMKYPHQVFSRNMNELIRSGLEREWFSQSTNYPTKKLAINIKFPKGLNPYEPDVSIWDSAMLRITNPLEHKRILNSGSFRIVKSGGQRKIVGLDLLLDYPLIGLHYAITWRYI